MSEMKKDLRLRAARGRDALPLERRKRFECEIRARLFALEQFKVADKVLFYASFRTEVDTGIMIKESLEMGKTVILPRVHPEENRLTKHVIDGLEELVPGHMGILEPDMEKHSEIKVEDIHMLVIPGLAFDIKGARIGYGGGYYDRLLPRIKGERTIAALAFEAQIFESLPMENHDIPVDYIITEQRIINCHG
ncbi:MAG: 5-formyltetrahydrofolate cyclo-ligase [Thermodesulfovibrionales bacterium]|nr:5-formyltetrahydrofolate cyclo-ligase [Thermodesulfovibrionales bacterium]